MSDYLSANERAAIELNYIIQDSHGAQTNATATINVIGQNDAPTFTIATAITDENAAVTFDVLSNASDAEGGVVLTDNIYRCRGVSLRPM
jgi:hypothetical protein